MPKIQFDEPTQQRRAKMLELLDATKAVREQTDQLFEEKHKLIDRLSDLTIEAVDRRRTEAKTTQDLSDKSFLDAIQAPIEAEIQQIDTQIQSLQKESAQYFEQMQHLAAIPDSFVLVQDS